MKKALSFIKKPWVIVLIVIFVLVVLFSLRGGSPAPNFETEVVSKRDLQEIVSELGTVEAQNSALLSFGASGTVSEILVSEGDQIEAGQVIARLSTPALAFRVEEARARLAAEEARLSEAISGLSAAERNVVEQSLTNAELSYGLLEESQRLALEEARSQVESARRALNSSNLTARLEEGGREDSNRSYAPPTISGTYSGEAEGAYEITLYPSHSQTGYSFRYSGIESGVGSVSTVEPQRLGRSGLYIIFPENFARNSNLKWVVEIPNKNSPNYATLKNALDSALLAERNTLARSEQSLAEAEASLELARAERDYRLSGSRPETITAQTANVNAARFSLSQAEAAYNDSVIRAPFSGTIATLTANKGERVNPGQEVVSLISTGDNQIAVYVSETDIARLDVGDTASIRLDAFRGEQFDGKVTFVSPIATSVQGVMRFKVIIELTDTNPNLRTGLSADVDINTEERLDVVSIPSRAVVRESNRSFVRVKEGEAFREVAVTTGLRSSDGYTEIISGLNIGDEVITYISPQELNRLENLRDE